MNEAEPGGAAGSDRPVSPRSVGELIDYGTGLFESSGLYFGHGSDNAFDESVHLVLFALGIEPQHLNQRLLEQPDDHARQSALQLLESRAASREPAAYLTGTAWLHGLPFDADRRALIPRSLLVEVLYQALPEWIDVMGIPVGESFPERVLDLCCGSGSIAVHAAHAFESAEVTAVDISEPALDLCRQNLRRHNLAERIELIQSDLFNNIGDQQFDLMLCNPPYVPDPSMATLPAEFLTEPDLALRGGADGMDIAERIVSQAAGFLSPQGILLMEIGHEASHFEERFPGLPFSYLPVDAGDQMVVAITRNQLAQL